MSTGTTLVSGEGVRLELATAGVASRVLATLIDLAVQVTGLLLLFVITSLATLGSGDTAALAAIGITESVLVLAGYPIVVEWLTRGRTLGKLCLGLRVVRDDGGPIGLRHAVVRGLASLVLEKPGLLPPLSTAAGVITSASSARDKRIGDLMAGTVVLNERAAPMALGDPPMWVPVPLQPWVLSLDLTRLDDRLALLLRQFVARAHAMSPAAQAELEARLRAQVLAVVSPPPPPGAPTPEVLMGVLAERRRRALSGETGPWRGAGLGARPAPPTPSAPYWPPSPPGPQAPPGPPPPFVAPA